MLSRDINFDLIFNSILILILIFSENYLEEDLIIGLFSSIILLFLFFFLKNSKITDIRIFRLYVKKVYRIQKKLLNKYYFVGFFLHFFRFRYTKYITITILLNRLYKVILSIFFKIKNFFSKRIYIQFFYLKLIYSNVFFHKDTIEIQNCLNKNEN